MKRFAVLLLMAASAGCLFAQRDFLTSDEIEKIREAQEPNARLNLYLLFARQRMDQLQQLLGKDKKGRSLAARELLDDYSRIIDAIDNVSNDAIKRKQLVVEGTVAVMTAEKKFLGQLEKIRDGALPDLGLYEVALREAIETTSDSLELAHDDPGKRSVQLNNEIDHKVKDAEDMIAAEDSKGKVTEAVNVVGGKTTEANGTDAKPKRKPPTLLKPGEGLPPPH